MKAYMLLPMLPHNIDHANIVMVGKRAIFGVTCSTLDTDTVATEHSTRKSPKRTSAPPMGAARYSCNIKSPTPTLAIIEPHLNAPLIGRPNQYLANNALGTINKANTTATRPEVT